jgi:division protein CdvB (Snf7/Vps24/ESCRT-III family)
MESHDLDKEEAEHVQEIMEEYGLDEDDAVELSEEL